MCGVFVICLLYVYNSRSRFQDYGNLAKVEIYTNTTFCKRERERGIIYNHATSYWSSAAAAAASSSRGRGAYGTRPPNEPCFIRIGVRASPIEFTALILMTSPIGSEGLCALSARLLLASMRR